MIYRAYLIKSGRFTGMYHVRQWDGIRGRYFHIGRYNGVQDDQPEAVNNAILRAQWKVLHV